MGEDSSAEQPTAEDLVRSRVEISRYCSNNDPLFLLMNNPNCGEVKRYDIVEDDQLPLSVYETVTTAEKDGNAVFVNVEFELETFDPERIALEKVFRDAPSISSGMMSEKSSSGSAEKEELQQRKVKKSKKEEVTTKSSSTEEGKKKAVSRPPSKLDGGLDGLQCSIRAMNARIRILIEFLRKVEKEEMPPDHCLLNSVNGLIQQLPLVYAALEEGVASSFMEDVSSSSSRTPLRELENEYNDTMLLSYLAALAKTANTVHTYTEKYRTSCETRRG